MPASLPLQPVNYETITTNTSFPEEEVIPREEDRIVKNDRRFAILHCAGLVDRAKNEGTGSPERGR
jgi:hypothetical protein